MHARIMSCLMYGVICVVFLRCSKEPEVIFQVKGYRASLTGFVRNPELLDETKVYLQQNNKTVAVTTPDINTGRFVFSDIPYGIYWMSAVCGKWSAREEILVDKPFVETYNLSLQYQKHLLSNSSLIPGDTITPLKWKWYDFLFPVSFILNSKVRLDTSVQPVLIQPAFLNGCTKIVLNESLVQLMFPPDSLFKVPQLSIDLFCISGENDSLVKDTVSISYIIDSTFLGIVMTHMLFDTVHTSLRDFPLEDTIFILFHQAMDKASVEKSISTQPQFPLNFFWKNNRLNCVPVNSLKPDTSYILTIGTTAMTKDSLYIRTPVNINISTENRNFFSSHWPLDSMQDVSPYPSFTFTSSYSLDAILLQRAFSISPVVDSLKFVEIRPGTIEVSHAPLLPDTSYTILISETLTSKKGTPLGHDMTIHFSTRKSINYR